MKLWCSPYEIVVKSHLNRSSQKKICGALLKIQTKDIEAGYADLCPLTLFGDADVQAHLESFLKAPLPLLKKSLDIALKDGMARAQSKALFSEEKIRSHYTCVDWGELNPERLAELQAQGFQSIKLKAGRDSSKEANVFSQLVVSAPPISWRFDFNSNGGEELLSLLDKKLTRQIELIEDPIPYDETLWKELESKHQVSLARDMGVAGGEPFRKVIKPARDVLAPQSNDLITNCMDHPLGQAYAFYQAQVHVSSLGGEQPLDYGLCTAHLVETNKYFEAINGEGPFFDPPSGHGLGFDDLLSKEPWQLVGERSE